MATGDSVPWLPVGDFTSSPGWRAALLQSEVAQPDLVMSGSVRLAGDDPSSAVGLAYSPSRRLSPSTPMGGFGTPRLGPSPLASWHSGDHLLSPRAPLMRCPGAVTPPRRLARGSGQPRPASSPEERILRRCSGSLAMPLVRIPVGSPPAIVPTAWPRRTTFHPYKGVEEPEPCLSAGAR
jgi:hypothetical protein